MRNSIRHSDQHTPREINLTTFKGDGLQDGVDIDSNAILLDIMDAGTVQLKPHEI